MPENTLDQMVASLHHEVYMVASERSNCWGPEGRPVVVGDDVWRISTMDFRSFNISSSVKAQEPVYYAVHYDSVAKNTTFISRQALGIYWDTKGEQPVSDSLELEWLLEMARRAVNAGPYIAYIQPFGSWASSHQVKYPSV